MKFDLILFDGECNLCSFWVQFVSKWDKSEKYKFASLQSSFSKKTLKKYNHNKKMNTIVLIKNDVLYEKSTAILKIIKNCAFPVSLLYVFILVPKIIRDPFYSIVSKYRYIIFGKKLNCEIPDKLNKETLVDKFDNIYKNNLKD